MPTYSYIELSPLTVPEVVTAHRTHTDGANHVTEFFIAPWPCRVIAMRYQITETLANDLVAAVIALGVGDRAGALTADIASTLTTLADGLAAADTVYEVLIPGGQAITAGDSVVAQVHTAGTDSVAPAGIARVWAVIQPSEM